MLSLSESDEVDSIFSWTSQDRRLDPVQSADSPSCWPGDQSESILSIDGQSTTWSGVERFSDFQHAESDFEELTGNESVSIDSGDKPGGSHQEESGLVTLNKIEGFALDILQQINCSGKYQALRQGFPSGPSNPAVLPVQSNVLAQLLRILELSHDAILGKMIMTKRDAFYNDVNLFKKQAVVDRLVDDLAATLEITRGELHFAASPKGLFQGDIELIIIGDTVTSGHGPPVLIPPSDTIKEIKPGAGIKFILIVEKEAIFNMLVNMNFTSDPRLGPSLIICGVGYPSLSTRQLASRLSEHHELVERQVPILMLVDCDPHGLDIAKVYKLGSQSMSFHPGLCAKQAEWIGISSSDWNEFGIDCDLLCPMTLHDYKKAESLLLLDALPESWKNEVRCMMQSGKKSEIQILCSQADSNGKPTNPEVQCQSSNSNHRLFYYLSKKIKQVIKLAI